MVAKAAGFERFLPACEHTPSVSARNCGKGPSQVAAAMQTAPGIARELLLPNTNKVHNEKGEIQREKRLAAGRRPTGLCHACRITGAAQAAPPAHRHITHD